MDGFRLFSHFKKHTICVNDGNKISEQLYLFFFLEFIMIIIVLAMIKKHYFEEKEYYEI